MTRLLFRRAPVNHATVRGELVADIQSAITASGVPGIGIDGKFGNNTRNGVIAFQNNHGYSPTGEISATEWTALIGTSAPPIFDRCLQVAAAFEGTWFDGVTGNFDGAGITWGIVGFTLDNNEIGELLQKIQQQYPALVTTAFGADEATIMTITSSNTPRAAKIAWADSVTDPADAHHIVQPWKGYFKRLSDFREVQQMQVAEARARYWTIAVRDFTELHLTEELDYLTCFDVAVHNGGMMSVHEDTRMTPIKQKFAQQAPTTAVQRRQIIAEVVANSIESASKRADTLVRKSVIAVGQGVVHADHYDLTNWGFMLDTVPAPGTV